MYSHYPILQTNTILQFQSLQISNQIIIQVTHANNRKEVGLRKFEWKIHMAIIDMTVVKMGKTFI